MDYEKELSKLEYDLNSKRKILMKDDKTIDRIISATYFKKGIKYLIPMTLLLGTSYYFTLNNNNELGFACSMTASTAGVIGTYNSIKANIFFWHSIL